MQIYAGVKRRNLTTSSLSMIPAEHRADKTMLFPFGVYREFGPTIMEIKFAEINAT